MTTRSVHTVLPCVLAALSVGTLHAAEPKAAHAVTVLENDRGVVVDTGAIVVTVPKTWGAGISAVTRGDQEVFRATPTDGPSCEDASGARCRAALDKTPAIAIEEAGPDRAVVRVEARSLDREPGPDDVPLAPTDAPARNVLVYTFEADSAQVRLSWTFTPPQALPAGSFAHAAIRFGSGAAPVVTILDEGALRQEEPGYYRLRPVAGEAVAGPRTCELSLDFGPGPE